MKTSLFTTLALLLIVFSYATTAFTQTVSCGNITAPAGWDRYFDPNATIQTNPIENCSNPFGSAALSTSEYRLLIAGNVIVENDIIPTVNGMTDQYVFDTKNRNVPTVLFLHDNDNYRYVDTEELELVEADYRMLAARFFPEGTDIEPFIAAYLSSNPYTYFSRDDERRNQLFAFDVYIYNNWVPKRPVLQSGTYTLVFREILVIPVQRNILLKFAELFTPTATAFSGTGVYSITFTITNLAPEPTGASSVLFLPGIQASRLYAGEDGPGGSAFERIWEPSNNDDVQALAMNPAGETVKKVYTSDILKTVTTDLLFGYQYESGSVYQGFSNSMDALVTDETIREWYPFAYDWRYDVFDIVQNGTIVNQAGVRQFPAKIAKELARRSKSGKVTIIAHSNGGLLAKALMIELKKTGDESLVDQIIFLGTPQLGTPKALGTILHGYDQAAGAGLVIRGTTARSILNNFPGAYALLPSAAYLSQTDTPIISFDNSVSTALYRTTYGSSISGIQTYQNFLNGTPAENRSLDNKIYQPVSANTGLLTTALTNHVNQLDAWVAPSSTKVVSIIGTGIPTIKALRYEDVVENICPANTIFSTLSLCAVERLPRPFAIMTYFGDKTVTGLSAKGYAGSGDRYYVDLLKISKLIPNELFDHANFTETNYVQTLLKNLIATNTIPTIPYIITQEPVVVEPYIIQQIASPVYMYSTDASGRVTGYVQQNGSWILKQDIPGSQYFEFSGVKYLLIPKNIDFKTTLAGQEFGGYTYKISELNDTDTQTQLSQLVNATTTPTMMAVLEIRNGQLSTIKTDYNGDGLTDYESTVNGVTVVPPPLYTYKKLIDSINALTIKKSQKDVLLFLAKEAERLDIKSVTSPLAGKLEKVTLKVLESTIQLYQRTKLISVVQAEELLKIIKFLST